MPKCMKCMEEYEQTDFCPYCGRKRDAASVYTDQIPEGVVEVNNVLVSVMMEIEEQPTAYDVDKVVAELEKELKRADEEKIRCVNENPLQFDEVKGYARGISVAIQIVKGGGVDG